MFTHMHTHTQTINSTYCHPLSPLALAYFIFLQSHLTKYISIIFISSHRDVSALRAVQYYQHVRVHAGNTSMENIQPVVIPNKYLLNKRRFLAPSFTPVPILRVNLHWQRYVVRRQRLRGSSFPVLIPLAHVQDQNYSIRLVACRKHSLSLAASSEGNLQHVSRKI